MVLTLTLSASNLSTTRGRYPMDRSFPWKRNYSSHDQRKPGLQYKRFGHRWFVVSLVTFSSKHSILIDRRNLWAIVVNIIRRIYVSVSHFFLPGRFQCVFIAARYLARILRQRKVQITLNYFVVDSSRSFRNFRELYDPRILL